MNHLLSTADLRLIEPLRLQPRRTHTAKRRGERLTRAKGVSVEFADFRDYAPGDDLRHLDWNLLARLDRPTLRTYQDEEELGVYLLVDTSRSMEWGEPTKGRFAATLAAALGRIALAGQDAVYPTNLGNAREKPRALRGRVAQNRLDKWLEALRFDAQSETGAALARFAAGGVSPGLVFCLSDGMDAQITRGINALGARGFELIFIQILSPEEQHPDLEGDVRLLDVENGNAVELTAHAEALAGYQRNLAAHNAALDDAVKRAGGRYVFATTTNSLADVLLLLRRADVVG